MAGAFTHRWQGVTLGSLPRAELIRVACLLDSLLERETGQRMDTDLGHAGRTNPELILAVWRLDLALEKYRPLRPSSRRDQDCPTPSASMSSKSDGHTRTTPARDADVRGWLIDLWAES